MIIMKIRKGFYICESPIDGTHYAIIQSHKKEACFSKCCFASYCLKFNDTKKPLLKYFGIDKTCAYFLYCAKFDCKDGNLFYFRKYKGGI